MSQLQQYYQRFSLAQRLEHWTQVLAFTVLALTGLPQKFAGAGWAETMIAALGGIENVRIYHRMAATLLLLGVIYHGGAVTYRLFVKRTPLSMMPGWQDVKDFYAVFVYNLGLKTDWPKMPRFNFEEKMEYWAFGWGAVVMVITGFMLWNPIATTRFFPGSFIPAAKAAHGGEAVLAVLALILWHMYGVHLRKFNRSMFTGQISHADIAHEHALELAEIEQDTRIQPEPEEYRQRLKIFIPVSVVITLVLLAGLYWFVTFEKTAITTVAAATNEQEAYQPLPLTSGGNIHSTITAYNGPETCSATGCHPGEVITAATQSPHNRRIVAAGPNPILAKLADTAAPAEAIAPNCLVCHAKEYNADDLPASAKTVGAAGSNACQRCHSGQNSDSVHNQAVLACTSCHTATSHQIMAEVKCANCHAEQPHSNPFLNTNHQRLDCRTCHVKSGVAGLTADTSQPVQDPHTKFYGPRLQQTEGAQPLEWQTAAGQAASNTDAAARIVPVIPVTVLAPQNFNPAKFAVTGQILGEPQQTRLKILASHNITKTGVKTCGDCHGPEATFDFAGLGYDKAAAAKLAVKAANPAE